MLDDESMKKFELDNSLFPRTSIYGFKKAILARVRRLQMIVTDSRRYILRTLRKAAELGCSYFDVKRIKHVWIEKGVEELDKQLVSPDSHVDETIVHYVKDDDPPLFEEKDLLNPLFAFLNETVDVPFSSFIQEDYVDVDDHISRNLGYQRYKTKMGPDISQERSLIQSLLVRGGIEQNPGPKITQVVKRKVDKDIDELSGLMPVTDYRNYHEGIVFFQSVCKTDSQEVISFVVNDLDQYMDGKDFACSNRAAYEDNRSKYEFYRIGNVRTEVAVTEGVINVIQVESLYNASKFSGYGAFSDSFATNKYVEKVVADQRYKKYVEGYYFCGCSEAYDSTYDNSKYIGLENPMFANVIIDADGISSTCVVRFAVRVQFFSRIFGDDNDMYQYFKGIGIRVQSDEYCDDDEKCDSSEEKMKRMSLEDKNQEEHIDVPESDLGHADY